MTLLWTTLEEHQFFHERNVSPILCVCSATTFCLVASSNSAVVRLSFLRTHDSHSDRHTRHKFLLVLDTPLRYVLYFVELFCTAQYRTKNMESWFCNIHIIYVVAAVSSRHLSTSADAARQRRTKYPLLHNGGTKCAATANVVTGQ